MLSSVLAIALTASTHLLAETAPKPTASKPVVNLQLASIQANSLAAPSISQNTHPDISQLLETGQQQLELEEDAAAANTFQRALTLIEAQTLSDPNQKGEALIGLMRAYFYMQNYEAALPVADEGLLLYEALAIESQPEFEWATVAQSDYADALLMMASAAGFIHRKLANFGTALTYYRRLALSDRPEDQLEAVLNIGLIQADIRQYSEAETTLQSSIRLSRQLENLCNEAISVSTLGFVAEHQENYEGAIAQYQAALNIYQTHDDTQLKDCEATSRSIRALNNIGMAQLKQGSYEAAQATFDRATRLLALQKDTPEQAILLGSLGTLAQVTGKPEQAWTTHIKALRLSQTQGDKEAEANKVNEIEIFSNLGQLMEEQNQPRLAIFFYKQAIAQVETIRQDLQQLERSAQQQHTASIEGLYRTVADLLLQQNRVVEALQILELLKLQEVKSYFHSGQEDAEALNAPSEAALLDVFNNLSEEITLAEFIQHPAATSLGGAPSPNQPTGTETDTLELQSIEKLQAALAEQPLRTAALYPLILEDRLELILLLPDGRFAHRTTQVTRSELSQTVRTLQKNLSGGILDSTADAQRLYGWIMGEMESVLVEQQIENIVYLPDGILRYIPIAVLHDGKDWFAEKYQSHNITAASIGNLTTKSPAAMSVLAGAFTNDIGSHTVEIGEETFVLEGLKFARQEIEKVKASLPNTTELIDRDFSAEKTLDAMVNQRIVHFATHAKFIPGQPEDSFILFGNGDTANLRDVGKWNLENVELVVFSACQTAMSAEAEGKEFLGLGFQVQEAGAGAAIASLWSVNDNATTALMNQFYIAIADGQSKAQALRTAQKALIESENFSDPSHWGAFILIGNGL